MNRLSEKEYFDFKMKVKRLDKERGDTYALGAIRGAIFLSVLTTQMQVELIEMVLKK